MRKIIIIILVIGVLSSAIYLIFINSKKQLNPDINTESSTESYESVRISNLSFSYKSSPDGYILIKDMVSWPEDIISSISLFRTRDYEWFSKPEFVGEYPPAFTVSVFENPERLSAQVWAETRSIASNIELIDSPPVTAEVGGVEGINYIVLGLYLYDTYVFAYDNEIYLISSAYHEKGDEYYQNAVDVIATAVFD